MNPIEDSTIHEYIERIVLPNPIGKIVSREDILFGLTQELGFPDPKKKAFRSMSFQNTRQVITQKMNQEIGWERYGVQREKSRRYGIAWRRIR